jgi:UPF0716 protein FxsA
MNDATVAVAPWKMDPVPSIIYVAIAEDKAPDLPIRLLPLIPFAWFVLEVVLLVEVGQAIGALAVVGLLIAAGLAGSLLLRHVGTSVVSSLLAQDPRGRSTIDRLRSAGWQVAAGILLIVPGFASDVVALALFLPPVRRLLSSLLPRPANLRTRSVVIEGEFRDVSPQDEPPARLPPDRDRTPREPHDNPWSDRDTR